ncbi:2-dehydropantoate 2-reductase [Allosphingosinicella deserti]|uniref:2-dehydropantoate 2-reductase n=1 Tax=Allosphingosinicella deserti TaxID=2116704 RepID=A0A2P7QRW7_9SPHN|nr:2-dehydropantoate 2-reductase [Sphingomonas deserti]PSJ40723.1 2-dehydropantoate 2-reductase [Sphingomonas deserti]
MTRIAVIGAGAIGGTAAAWLAQNEALDVALCVRTPIQSLHVETPSGPLSPRVTVWSSPAEARSVDWVLIATKAYDSEAAASWLPMLMAPSTCVAILQNGVEHRARVQGLVEDDRVVPAIVDIPAERNAPGRIHQRRTGSIFVADDQAGRAFVSLFAHTPIAVATTPDLRTAAWRKLAVNCAGAVNALTLQPGGISRNDDVAELMRGLIRECIAVGRAEGADLPDGLADDVVAGYRAGPADSVNSLLADRLAGRPMEIDARNGVIVRLGTRHGIATPLNAMAATLLRAVSPGGNKSTVPVPRPG